MLFDASVGGLVSPPAERVLSRFAALLLLPFREIELLTLARSDSISAFLSSSFFVHALQNVLSLCESPTSLASKRPLQREQTIAMG